MKAIILAAGDNTRFKKENSKHNKLLHPVLGIPLIERTILTAKMAGITEFIIITGYQDNKIRKLLGKGTRLGVSITYAHNKSWRGENGTSTYTARELLHDNFILLMGDHLFSSKSLFFLRRAKLDNQEVVLAIDKKILEHPGIQEATKAKEEKGKIIAIGKELRDYNAIDTGMFLCSPYLFTVLDRTVKSKKFYLTDAMRIITREDKLRSFNIKDSFWADIDTHKDLYMAEDKLFEVLTKPSEEGIISKYINRRFSNKITRFIINSSFTPNQITLFSLMLAILGGALLTYPSYTAILMGGILAQFSSIIDGVDGEVARIKLSTSAFGAWFDSILDRYGDIAIIAGASIGVYGVYPNLLIVLIGILALTGSIMSSYSSHTFQTTYGRSFGQELGGHFILPSGRDTRLFIIFIGSLFNAILPALIAILLLTNYAVIYRLFLAKWTGD